MAVWRDSLAKSGMSLGKPRRAKVAPGLRFQAITRYPSPKCLSEARPPIKDGC